jgi:hypothetical protein
MKIYRNQEYENLGKAILENFTKRTGISFNVNQEQFFLVNLSCQFSYFLSFGNSQNVASFCESEKYFSEVKTKRSVYQLVCDITKDIFPDKSQWKKVLVSDSFHYGVFQMLSWLIKEDEPQVKVAVFSKHGDIHRDILIYRLLGMTSRPTVIVEYDEQPDLLLSDYVLDRQWFENLQGTSLILSPNPLDEERMRLIEVMSEIRERKWKQIIK